VVLRTCYVLLLQLCGDLSAMSFESLQAGLSVDVESFLFGVWILGHCTCAFWLLDILYRISCIMHLLSMAIIFLVLCIVLRPWAAGGSVSHPILPLSAILSVLTLLRPIQELPRFE
jgi:hypothetical protein